MVTTRTARADDEAFVLALTDRLADFPLPGWRTATDIAHADHHLLRAALQRPSPDILLLIAEDSGGLPVGFAFATSRHDYFTGAPQAHVETLALEEQVQGQGVARVLMAVVETWAHERGCASVTLNVFETNARARGLYAHLGYQPETLHYIKPL